jgi:hypothetical protein
MMLAIERLRSDLRNLSSCSADWPMFFNIDKSRVIHFGCNNRKRIYEMNEKVLQTISERDLGVIVQ